MDFYKSINSHLKEVGDLYNFLQLIEEDMKNNL